MPGPRAEWVRAPSFALPVYSKVSLSVPLEHHRRSIKRQLAEWNTEIFHVSTPGPFGCLGLSLAHQLKLPIVGIYHTDFPGYAHELVAAQINRLRRNPGQMFGPIMQQLMPLVGPSVERTMSAMEDANPDLGLDFLEVQKIFQRNMNALEHRHDLADWMASAARRVAVAVVRRFYRKFTFVLARSTAQLEVLRTDLDLPDDRIRLLPAGTDTDRFRPDCLNNSWRAPFCESQSDQLFLYVGRFTTEKNFDFLLNVWRAFKQQRQRQPSGGTCKLLLAGFGAEEAQARLDLDAMPDVYWLGGLAGDELSRAYASCDLLLFPSRTETLGQVGMEAMASGTPVIASSEGGPSTYIEHGQTGWLLDATQVQDWVELLGEVQQSPDLLKQVGHRAVEHIRTNFTIEHSIQSYWALHREALVLDQEKHKDQRAQSTRTFSSFAWDRSFGDQAPKRSNDQASQDKQLTGIMMISDYHAGRRYGTSKHRAQKSRALEAMFELAAERRLEVVFGGDFGDHGANPSRQKKDLATFREIRSQVLPYADPVFIRGNHDYGYSDDQLQEMLGGCRVQNSLVWHHQQAQVTITHGHILGLSRTSEIASEVIQSKTTELLFGQLTEDALDEVLKPSIIAYDLANLIEAFFETKGLSGLSPFWEGLFGVRATLAERLTGLTQHASPADQKTWKLIASLLGAHDDVQTARLLGQACGSWVTLFGHTHEPMVEKFNDALSTKLIGNAGNMNRRDPTCLVARFPMLCVLEFDSRSGKLKPRESIELDHEQQDSYLSELSGENAA